MLSIKLLESTQQIEKKITTALAEEVNKTIRNNLTTILKKSKDLAVQFISSSPELSSLSEKTLGSLKAQFGIPDGQDILATSDIIQAVQESVSVTFSPYNKQLKGGGLQVNFQPSDFVNLLGLQSGHVVYSGGDLHWLSWLLKEGGRTIVVGYSYDPETGLGRSGLGTMSAGGFFRVPPEFSGTTRDNFVTRALIGKKQEADILNVFKSVLG
jgi:hypothetical protein